MHLNGSQMSIGIFVLQVKFLEPRFGFCCGFEDFLLIFTSDCLRSITTAKMRAFSMIFRLLKMFRGDIWLIVFVTMEIQQVQYA